jgi:hypothetical protein
MADRNNSTAKKKLQPISGHNEVDMWKFIFQSSAGDIYSVNYISPPGVSPSIPYPKRSLLSQQSSHSDVSSFSSSNSLLGCKSLYFCLHAALVSHVNI